MRRWLDSLGGRITLVTVGVAVIAVVLTGFISLQLVKQSTLADGRTQLGAQAQLLSRLPSATNLAELRDRVRLALPATKVAIVATDGTVTGAGAPYVTPRDVEKLIAGTPVSAVEQRNTVSVIVEGRPTKSGSAIVLVRTKASLDKTTQESGQRILIALLIGVGVAILAGTLLARWLTRPLIATARTAARMAAGERGLAIELHRPTEIAAVSDALASLDSALTLSESRQREFLLSISHELRTPLTAVRGYGEAMVDGLIGPGQVAAVGATLVAETERLDRFVSDLLELARLEADDFAIDHQPVDVAELIALAAEAWRGKSATLGVSILTQPTGAALTLLTDGRRVRQVLDGLIENALRVSPEGTAITLTARADAAATVIEVRDGGPGLSADDLAVAFDRGVLQSRYRDIRPVGTGLGLSIAARLVARLGGAISAGNNAGGGAVFTVSFQTG